MRNAHPPDMYQAHSEYMKITIQQDINTRSIQSYIYTITPLFYTRPTRNLEMESKAIHQYIKYTTYILWVL